MRNAVYTGHLNNGYHRISLKSSIGHLNCSKNIPKVLEQTTRRYDFFQYLCQWQNLFLCFSSHTTKYLESALVFNIWNSTFLFLKNVFSGARQVFIFVRYVFFISWGVEHITCFQLDWERSQFSLVGPRARAAILSRGFPLLARWSRRNAKDSWQCSFQLSKLFFVCNVIIVGLCNISLEIYLWCKYVEDILSIGCTF